MCRRYIKDSAEVETKNENTCSEAANRDNSASLVFACFTCVICVMSAPPSSTTHDPFVEELAGIITKRRDLLSKYAADNETEWKIPTIVEVWIARLKLTTDVFDSDIDKTTFLELFSRAMRREAWLQANGAPPSLKKTRCKAVCLRDMLCERSEIGETKIFKHTVWECGAWDDALAIATAYTQERLPVLAFPCTADANALYYVKCTQVKIHPRVLLCFESRVYSNDGDEKTVHKIYLRTRVNTRTISDTEASALAQVLADASLYICGERDRLLPRLCRLPPTPSTKAAREEEKM